MTIITNNESETIAEGEKLGKTLSPGMVVALFGGLGVGKTAFTKGLALGLGIEDTVSSPTFTIANEYRGKIPLFHFDMYRLESESDLFDIGWDDYLEREGICVVEWSEKILGALPSDSIYVKIQNMGCNVRSIEIANSI
jgi:tRNA threonylcarbamoyladenosine biosynthesis protein TsaE